METFLQIVGAIVLVVVALVGLALLGGWLYIRYQVWQIKKIATMMGGPIPPVRIELQELSDARWPDPHRVERLTQELQEQGFYTAGTFTVPGMQGLIISGFANPDLPAYASLTHHPFSGLFCEVCQFGPDGSELTVTQSETLSKTRPVNNVAVSLPTASVRELVWELKNRAKTGELPPHTVESFKQAFEDGYYASMKFAYEQGDLKAMDASAIAQFTDQAPDPATLEFLESLDQGEPDDDERFTEAFLSQSSLSALEWERIREHIVFIHDQLETDDVADLLSGLFGEDEDPYELAESAKTKNARETFAWLAQRISAPQGPELLTHLEEPEACDVYRLPSL
jgi:hypothetical protein